MSFNKVNKSSTYGPRSVAAENTDIAEKVASLLQEEDIPFVRAGLDFRVAPAYDGDLAKAFIDARASEEEKRQASLRELEASIDVGGLSLDEARRLVRSVQSGGADATARNLPNDLQSALGLRDPDHVAEVRVVFARSYTPSRHEVRGWLVNAITTYFNDHEKYCGVTDGDANAQDVIKSVQVTSVEAHDE